MDLAVSAALSILLFFATNSAYGVPDEQAPAWLADLCSPDEAARFKVLEVARKQHSTLKASHIHDMLAKSGDRNWSTLVFVCLKERNTVLQGLGPQDFEKLSHSKGVFPNLAFYLGEVVPAREGLVRLLELEKQFPDQDMPICKGIGINSSAEALRHLLDRCHAGKKEGRSILPPLSGLSMVKTEVPFKEVASLLDLPLDREEILLLAKCKTRLAEGDMEDLLKGGHAKALFATEKILMDPESSSKLILSRLEKMIKDGQVEKARLLLNSDALRRVPAGALQDRLKALVKQLQK